MYKKLTQRINKRYETFKTAKKNFFCTRISLLDGTEDTLRKPNNRVNSHSRN